MCTLVLLGQKVRRKFRQADNKEVLYPGQVISQVKNAH